MWFSRNYERVTDVTSIELIFSAVVPAGVRSCATGLGSCISF